VTQVTPEYTQSFENPGPVAYEIGGIATYYWFADNRSSGGANIYGYFGDPSADGALKTTVHRDYTDPEGEIGEVSGLAFEEDNNMLYVADTAKNRILSYPRVNPSLPADQVTYGSVGQTPTPVSDSGAAAGSGLGEFDGVRGITTRGWGTDPQLIVSDLHNARLQVFDSGPTGLSNPQAFTKPSWDPDDIEPQDVAIGLDGRIYVAMLGGPNTIEVFDADFNDLGGFGNPLDAGYYNQIDIDPISGLIFGSKSARVDVLSQESQEILGSYAHTSFAEPAPIFPDSGARMVKYMTVVEGAKRLYMNRYNPNSPTEPADPKPAQAYTLSADPTCTPEVPFISAASGTTTTFSPNCTDANGAPVEEFSVQSATRGSVAPTAGLDEIAVTAPTDGSGMASFNYRVTTMNGKSTLYNQKVVMSADSKIADEIFPGRNTSMVNFPDLAYAEGVGGLAKYIWVADSDGNQTILRGYNQISNDFDGDDSDPIAEINCTGIGELGGEITGIEYLPNQNFLLVADADNGRLVLFPRQNDDSDPVDCDNAIQIFSVGGHTLSAGRGLAGTNAGEVYMSIDDADPQGGVIRFSLDHLGAATFLGYSNATDFQPNQIAIGGGRVFSVLDSTGVIDVRNPDLSTASIGPLSSGSGGDFISLSVQANTNRLFAMKANELSVFSTTTGTLLGKTDGIYFGGNGISVTTIENYQGAAIFTGTDVELRDIWLNPNPICNLAAPLNVTVGSSVTFVPTCTDQDNSTVREFSVTNAQTRGTAAPTPALDAITYVAGASTGQDDIAYSVQTQDGQSVVKHQAVNVVAPAVADPPAEKPVVRETTNLQLDSGDVYIKIPGSNEFVKLTKDMLIPVGTIIDAREGKAHLTLANADGTTYDGIFWEGIFQVIQGSGSNPITTMKLRDDLVAKASGFATARTSAELERSFYVYTAKKRGKKKNGLWGDAKGKFRTTGKGGSAAVRGTRWYVANYANGSLFKVSRGVVEIDPIRGKNFKLKAGKQFFIFYKRGD
jgi:hypothetical protein